MKATARAAPLEDGIWGVNRDTAYGLLSNSSLIAPGPTPSIEAKPY